MTTAALFADACRAQDRALAAARRYLARCQRLPSPATERDLRGAMDRTYPGGWEAFTRSAAA